LHGFGDEVLRAHLFLVFAGMNVIEAPPGQIAPTAPKSR